VRAARLVLALGIAVGACDDARLPPSPRERAHADEARADALGLLATPHDATTLGQIVGPRGLPRPEATLVVHVARETLDDWVAGPGLSPFVPATATSTPGPPDARIGGRRGRGRAGLRSPGVARVEGPGGLDDVGPLLADQVRDLLGHARVRVLPVIDLAGEPAIDAYEAPDRIRTQVVLRDTHSRFPYSTRAARSCDLDHTKPYQAGAGQTGGADQRGGISQASTANPTSRPGQTTDVGQTSHADTARSAGQTRPGNLGALDRAAHRAKTHGGWHLTQPHPGVFDWTSPLGYHYRVDPHGSRRLSQITETTIRAKPTKRMRR